MNQSDIPGVPPGTDHPAATDPTSEQPAGVPTADAKEQGKKQRKPRADKGQKRDPAKPTGKRGRKGRKGVLKLYYLLTDKDEPATKPVQFELKSTRIRDAVREVMANAQRADCQDTHRDKHCRILGIMDEFDLNCDVQVKVKVTR